MGVTSMKSGARLLSGRPAIMYLCAALGLGSMAANAAMELSQTPLFLGGAVEPNIMLTMDDSGSMTLSFMPDSIAGDVTYSAAVGYTSKKRALAFEWNKLAYNPFVTYSPPPIPGNESRTLTDSTFNGAKENGYSTYTGETSCAVNLSKDYRPTWGHGTPCDGADGLAAPPEYWGPIPANNTAAFYYIHRKDYWATVTPDPLCPNPADPASLGNDACYVKVTVDGNSGPSARRDERQNFANWYTYYRKRLYTAKVGIAKAFSGLGSGVRVGLGQLHPTTPTDLETKDGFVSGTVTRGVRKFAGTDRTSFLAGVYKVKALAGNELISLDVTYDTPLRRAADDVGRYFMWSDANNKDAWGAFPGTGGGPAPLSCRRAFHVLMTDGNWNGAAGSVALPTVDYDDQGSPYQDGRPGTLADVAMYYWLKDLRSDLTDSVPPGSLEPQVPANQHLNTFAVAVGAAEGTVPPETAFAAITTGAAIVWQDPTLDPLYKIDDLLHAAVNSRGAFANVQDSAAVDAAFSQLLRIIVDETTSAASVVLNSGALLVRVEGGNYKYETQLYQAVFDSGDWNGDVVAYAILDASTVAGIKVEERWRASKKLPASSVRDVATVNSDTKKGVAFYLDQVSSAQQSMIGPHSTLVDSGGSTYSAQQILDYLRGERTLEQQVGSGELRNRGATVLGDFVNSAPAYVGAPSAPYPDTWCQILDVTGKCAEPDTGYLKFRYTDHANRTPAVYVGANDGMLHAFNADARQEASADAGKELFAFIPSVVMPNLYKLADPNYIHRYFVDGGPTVGDAFFGTAKKWATVLVGGLNAGGRAIYALDITDPTIGSAKDKVLWEFTAENDPDLGYTYSRPNIVRLEGGKWMVLFGNGYNSTESPAGTGNGYLFGLDVETGPATASKDRIKVPIWDPLSKNSPRPTGLSTVAPVDVNGDYNVDFVYAGDLYGNLWKFTMGGTPKATLLFKAKQATVNEPPQPITVRPQVIPHPTQPGRIVLFGTGKYIEVGDNTNGDVQTIYGIWDNDAMTEIARGNLQPQTIVSEEVAGDYQYRVTSANTFNWATDDNANGKYGWYMDLKDPVSGATRGERQVSDPVVRNDRLIFTTLLPSDDVCRFGGDSWLMELDAATGARPKVTPFDVNGDGVFSLEKLATAGGDAFSVVEDGKNKNVASSGRKSQFGIMPTPAILARPAGGKEYKFTSSSTAAKVQVTVENPGEDTDAGRQSWLQLFRD
jgi:type IV pilus assembly protein PilY1